MADHGQDPRLVGIRERLAKGGNLVERRIRYGRSGLAEVSLVNPLFNDQN